MTEQREECIRYIEKWVSVLPDDIQDVLDIGIAGDVKPGGNYYLFKDKNYKTMDVDNRYNPDYNVDLTKVKDMPEFDVVICSNTIEHIFNLHAALSGCMKLLKKGGHLIIDCPWMYHYHPDDDFDDYWRISSKAMQKMLEMAGFKDIVTIQGKYCVSALAKKI